MKSDSKQHTLRHHELGDNIQLLSHIEPTYAPLISCYIDLRDGLSQARQYVISQKNEITGELTGHVQRECEQAFDDIVNALDAGSYDCRSLVVFSRSYEGDHFFRVLKLDTPLRNRISVSDVPDVLPLVLLQHQYGSYFQVSVSDQAVEIHELGLGTCTLRGMAPLPLTSSDESRLAIACNLLQRTMRSSSRLDVILDGELELMQKIYRTLPRLLRRRVIQLIPRQSVDSDNKIGIVGKMTHKRYREHLSSDRFKETVKSGQALDNVATGIPDSLCAIKMDVANRLYVAADDLDISVGSPWSIEHKDTVLDVIRTAIQNKVPIDFVGSSKMMQQAGGIVCLRREQPITHRPDRPGFTAEANSLQMMA
jgi:hypothetical protein